ncbi:hypothetical protein [Bacillus andreraoultii]|uniref:hypothetical protein n=1 Tax=Bacillus andreraoultii TaxID=1499685 RepID=UPI00053AB7F7|nr:hypothetical protein [Bacillus andreraoultii]
MSLKKQVVALVVTAAVLGTSVSAGATTYLSKTLTGVSAESGYVKLGSGKRYLKGTGTYGNGVASAMKVIAYWPDSVQASFTVKKGESSSASFTAVSTTDGGANQSYYIRWSGSSNKASANLKITD